MNEEKEKKIENIEQNTSDVDLSNDIEKNLEVEPDYVTREINLDDLYDGAVNNTVVIDPITNDEILMTTKKPNYTLLGIFFAIIILLVLYYVNNKSDIGRTTKDVEPKTTSSTTSAVKEKDFGSLTCTYSSKSDAESQNVIYVANYEENKIIDSSFNYLVMSTTNNTSAIIEDLKKQYETFFINNVSVNGNNVSYEKNDNGFSFEVKTNYKKDGYDGLVIIDNQTILFIKPTLIDTVLGIQKAYVEKGFNCSLTKKVNKE